MGARGPIQRKTGARGIDAERNPRVLPGDETGFELKPPPHLEPAAVIEFQRLKTVLTDPPCVLSARDQDALADMATCLVRLRAAEREIGAGGVVVQTNQGPRRNPAVMVAGSYRQSVLAWAARFGMTPDARARMALPVLTEADEDPHGLLD